MNSSWKFHHVGIASSSTERVSQRLLQCGGTITSSFEDTLQGVQGSFHDFGGLAIEVLASLDNSETLSPWTTSGDRMYQIAFEVNDFDEELQKALNGGARLVREPLPSVAFDGRRIAFVMISPGFLIELIEVRA